MKIKKIEINSVETAARTIKTSALAVTLASAACLAQPDYGSTSSANSTADCLLGSLQQGDAEYYGVHRFSIVSTNEQVKGKLPGQESSLVYKIETISNENEAEGVFIDLSPIGDLDAAYLSRKGQPVRYLDAKTWELQELHGLVLRAFIRRYCGGLDFFNAQQYHAFQTILGKGNI